MERESDSGVRYVVAHVEYDPRSRRILAVRSKRRRLLSCVFSGIFAGAESGLPQQSGVLFAVTRRRILAVVQSSDHVTVVFAVFAFVQSRLAIVQSDESAVQQRLIADDAELLAFESVVFTFVSDVLTVFAVVQSLVASVRTGESFVLADVAVVLALESLIFAVESLVFAVLSFVLSDVAVVISVFANLFAIVSLVLSIISKVQSGVAVLLSSLSEVFPVEFILLSVVSFVFANYVASFLPVAVVQSFVADVLAVVSEHVDLSFIQSLIAKLLPVLSHVLPVVGILFAVIADVLTELTNASGCALLSELADVHPFVASLLSIAGRRYRSGVINLEDRKTFFCIGIYEKRNKNVKSYCVICNLPILFNVTRMFSLFRTRFLFQPNSDPQGTRREWTARCTKQLKLMLRSLTSLTSPNPSHENGRCQPTDSAIGFWWTAVLRFGFNAWPFQIANLRRR